MQFYDLIYARAKMRGSPACIVLTQVEVNIIFVPLFDIISFNTYETKD